MKLTRKEMWSLYKKGMWWYQHGHYSSPFKVVAKKFVTHKPKVLCLP